MLFIAFFEDHADRLQVRRTHRQAHLRYLDRHSDRILVGGSLREAPDGEALGGLWIIEAENRAVAEGLCHEDPFWTEGLRKSVRLLHWRKGFPDRLTPV